MPLSIPKTMIVILIQVLIALIHIFRLGQLFNGRAYDLYYGYFSDLILPFGAYFLLSMNDATIPYFAKMVRQSGHHILDNYIF